MSYQRGKIEEIPPFEIILKWLVDLVVVIGIGLFISIFLGQRSGVTGYSMEPALTNGDAVLVDKLRYHFTLPKRFDIVVFSPKSDMGHYYMKRVIGLPGERVQIIDGMVYINGEKLKEPMETEKMLNAGLAQEEILLGEDEYFLLGDNRNNSEDSRFQTVGNVKFTNIVGKAWLKVTTLNDVGLIE